MAAYLQDVWAPHGPGSPQACAQDTKPCQMRKRRCNPPWDNMNKSAYHPVPLYRERYTNTCIHSYLRSCRIETGEEGPGVIGVKLSASFWGSRHTLIRNINENMCNVNGVNLTARLTMLPVFPHNSDSVGDMSLPSPPVIVPQSCFPCNPALKRLPTRIPSVYLRPLDRGKMNKDWTRLL